jgi:hypothetical protein
MQTLSRGIYYLAEMFQRAIHNSLAKSKGISTTLLQRVKGWWIATCKKPYLHAGIHYFFTIF